MERPILYKAPMILAILNESKTQTRRTTGLEKINKAPNDYELLDLLIEKVRSHVVAVARFKHISGELIAVPCPYGKPGDYLWCRETWKPALSETHTCFAYRADGMYKCGKKAPHDLEQLTALNGGWKASIHMPKVACRLFLEVTDVRVERLQQITEEDAVAEGCSGQDESTIHPGIYHTIEPVYQFKNLWESINGAGSWDKNPFCWVVKFKRWQNPN